jgi:DNA invertase Pin-like site-specific DNA recombinase
MLASAKKPRAYSYVRMSTDMQLKGDSLRRQLDQSREYAASQEWELLEEDELRDVGISAFSGANVSGGALGRFLEAVRVGKVEPGSFLIVESLDRLSRQEALKSFGLFSDIINAGVNIVTLADRKTYSAATTDFTDLMFSIIAMSRAHDESRTKSHRLSAAWENKRKNADTRKLTAKCPGWLKLSADKKSFDVIKKRADVVASIFEDTAAGIGYYSITRRLNNVGVPPFGRSNGWHVSSVAKILANRAVLGEFQPHRFVNGARVAEGSPIKDYFPAIMSDELFYRAQNARNGRRIKGGGRKGANISNLFSRLAKCAYCSSSMRFVNRGGPRGGTYLICDAAQRGLNCEKTGWRYNQFEASFLAFVKELDLESLVRSESDSSRRTDLDNGIAAMRGKLASLDEQRERTFELFAKSGLAADFVGQKLQQLERERLQVVNSLADKERERDELSSDLSTFYESKEQLKALLDRLQQSEGEDVYKLRAQISSRLKSLVSEILVAPLGSAPMKGKAITLKGNRITLVEEQEDSEAVAKHRRYFLVGFKDGTLRAVVPKENDPLEFEQQVVASKGLGILLMTPARKSKQLIRRPKDRVSLYRPPQSSSNDEN